MELKSIKKPEDILEFKREELGQTVFNYLFGNRDKLGPRFYRNTELIIPKDRYYGNKEPIRTSIGNYLLNFTLYNENIYKIIGYEHRRFSADVIEGNEKKIAGALLDDKINTRDVINYLNRVQFYGFGLNSMISASLTRKVMFELPEVRKRRDELHKQYKKEIDAGDIVIVDKIEKELLALAKKVIGNDIGMELYNSGSKASFSNNYKLTNVMKGGMLDLETGKYKVSMSNYEEGVQKEETHLFANAMTISEFAKGVGTQDGGYLVKKYMAAFQALQVDKKYTDCGSTETFELLVTDFNKKLLNNRYIKENNKVVELTLDNIDKYVGRRIQLYDPLYCCGDKLCNKCAGNLYIKLNIKNMGLTASKICSTIMNKSLKKKHDNTIKLYTYKEIDDDLVL